LHCLSYLIEYVLKEVEEVLYRFIGFTDGEDGDRVAIPVPHDIQYDLNGKPDGA
jgi:hypothetical protein